MYRTLAVRIASSAITIPSPAASPYSHKVCKSCNMSQKDCNLKSPSSCDTAPAVASLHCRPHQSKVPMVQIAHAAPQVRLQCCCSCCFPSCATTTTPASTEEARSCATPRSSSHARTSRFHFWT
eukprot:291286-Pelagomonas_calceolata.AAC.2